MPELPEVESVRIKLSKELKGEIVKEVVTDPHDRWLYKNVSANKVEKALTGAKITGAGRKGKYFWLELNRRPWPVFHFGMSGNVALFEKKKGGGHKKIWGGVELQSEGEDNEKLLWHSRLMLIMKSGVEMAFLDPRRFGRMWLAEDPWKLPEIKRLGGDPLLDFPSSQELSKMLARRKAPVKSVMLDQKVFAGIGNWLADEILFQSKIDPHRLASKLSAREISRIHGKTKEVCHLAVEAKAVYERFPKKWLFHVRWGKKAGFAGGKEIRHDEIGGRTTAWVPAIQK